VNLSPHFTLVELTHSNTGVARGISNIPNQSEMLRLECLAKGLEKIRTAMGAPLKINSAFRNRATNSAVGGASKSRHLTGDAADIAIGAFDRKKLVQAAIAAGFRGIGLGKTFLHVDLRPVHTVWPYQGGANAYWISALGRDPVGAVKKMFT
jgi:zinc D-Ala-D-Ala carboxypeptidase